MAEWIVEEGIGEHRAIRLEHGSIAEARVAWPGELAAGTVVEATVVSRRAGGSRGSARLADGQSVLAERLPRDLSEGARFALEITRPAIGEGQRCKLARGRPSEHAPGLAPTLADRLRAAGHDVRVVRDFALPEWDELVGEAFAGEVAFDGGNLLFSPTPAMLLIDVDGTRDARALALAAVAPLAKALGRFDVGGPVGIDFPTLTAKADRQAVDHALSESLAGWPHERTAMNGFGFVQLVARLERPSLLHRAAFDRPVLAARQLLRRAERLDGAGAIALSGHPALATALGDEVLAELARRTGREVRWLPDLTLALEAPHAQMIAR